MRYWLWCLKRKRGQNNLLPLDKKKNIFVVLPIGFFQGNLQLIIYQLVDDSLLLCNGSFKLLNLPFVVLFHSC